jgi:hypothetical protein
MSNKIIYPILIIIFSILIIFAIINNRNNSKLNSNIEKFDNTDPYNVTPIVNYYLDDSKDKLKSDAANNTIFTSKLINGKWTSDLSTVDANHVVSNFLVITLKPDLKLNEYNSTYGTIDYQTTNPPTPETTEQYDINFLLNENLTAISKNNLAKQLHIKFYNNFSSNGNVVINDPYPKPQEFNCVVSIYENNILKNKFASYKIYDDSTYKVFGELYRIIYNKKFYINNPPPVYDYTVYNMITEKNGSRYTFPPTNSLLTLSTDNNQTPLTPAQVAILNNYTGKMGSNNDNNTRIYCVIQRIFYSPTSNDKQIQTKISPVIELNNIIRNINNKQYVPNKIFITPFSADQTANKVSSFFRPYGTNIYFYKYIDQVVSYNYGSNNYYSISNISAFNLIQDKNNAKTITQPYLSYKNLNPTNLNKIVTNNYKLTFFSTVLVGSNSQMTDTTSIDFSVLLNVL